MRKDSRSPSRSPSHKPGSPLPSQTLHTSILPHVLPAPALVESVAGGAHFSGGGRPQSPEGQGLTHVLSHPDHHHSPQDLGLRKKPSSPGSPPARNSRHSVHNRGHSGTWDDERDKLTESKKQLLADLKELYACKPSAEIFARSWRKDAIFEDPLCYATGYDEYAAQWCAMPKFFTSSHTLRSRVMSSTHTPNRLVFSQTQEYTVRLLGRKKTIESIVTLDLDQEDKIMKMVDQWDGAALSEGFPSGFFRRANAKILPWIVRTPKQNLKN